MAVRRRTWIWAGAAIVIVLAAVTLLWFQPQKLFYDQRVDEALPTAAEPTGEAATPTTQDGSAGGSGGGSAGGSGGGTGGSSAPPATEQDELATGSFISREHETTGSVRALRLPDGQVVLRFEDFETSNGPVLVVWLTKNQADGPDELFAEQYIDLGPLKGNVGDQNYVVPPEVNLAEWTSVVVWCDRFDVSFGAANLAATPEA